MLLQLNISNYALIKQLHFEPSRGMNTITGETGAGKSILLGALGLLLGKRADLKVLMDQERKCSVEGTFSLESYNMKSLFDEHDLDYESETIIRREIAPSGKSRAFINDTPTTLDVLKQFGVRLMDIHSQHDTLLIGGKSFQRFVIDAFAEHNNLITSYSQTFQAYKDLKKTLTELQFKKQTDSEELEFNKLRYNELNGAKLNFEEFETLGSDLKIAENAQDIKSSLQTISEAGIESDYSTISSLQTISTELKKLSQFSSDYEGLNSRLESSILELRDILDDLGHREQEIDFDEGKVLHLQERFDLINGLLFKHKVDSISELEEIRDQLAAEIDLVANLDEALIKAEKDCASALKKVEVAGNKLSASRKKSIPGLEEKAQLLLADLGMPNAILKVQMASQEPDVHGLDDIEILFSANKGFEPQSIKKAASGGEMSRLLFAIKYILASKTALPTIVFDEIDTGVSGEISLRMGKMMQRMAEHHQVMSITHLPQVAACADKHFFVFKKDDANATHSDIRELVDEDRIKEIAKMLSGDNPSDAAFQNAKELLSLVH